MIAWANRRGSALSYRTEIISGGVAEGGGHRVNRKSQRHDELYPAMDWPGLAD